MVKGSAPPWLELLLSVQFFTICTSHPCSPRNECNMFCIQCLAPSTPFCYYCRSQHHSSHHVIQIRRSSYHEVVRVAEVEDILDISDVQTYVINSAKVLFLNERPQPRGPGMTAGKAAASSYNCEICSRALLDPFRFCSLGCKLVSIKSNANTTSMAGNGDDHGGRDGEISGSSGTMNNGSKNLGGINSSHGGDKPSSTRLVAYHHRRKGIPHRAPFF